MDTDNGHVDVVKVLNKAERSVGFFFKANMGVLNGV